MRTSGSLAEHAGATNGQRSASGVVYVRANVAACGEIEIIAQDRPPGCVKKQGEDETIQPRPEAGHQVLTAEGGTTSAKQPGPRPTARPGVIGRYARGRRQADKDAPAAGTVLRSTGLSGRP